MLKLFSSIRLHWTWFKWKRRAHKRRRPVIKVGNLSSFFRQLHDLEVRYVVLRWPDEVPLTAEAEAKFDGDLDIMVDSRDFRKFCRTVADHPGRIKIDMYSEGVQMGTGYVRLPYYPPPKAHEILENRAEACDGAFMIPAPRQALLSLCYHLCYHKGLLSGLPTGLEGFENPQSSRHDVIDELTRLANACGEKLPEQVTLLALHRWLQERAWEMPYDLLARWGKKNEWHHRLQQLEEAELEELRGSMRDLLVFMIREDAREQGAEEFIIEQLQNRFTVLDSVNLTAEQQKRVMAETRGADWTRHKSTLMVRPVRAVICHDPAPQPVPPDHPLGKIHFNVRNLNVFFKHELRKILEKRFPGAAANYVHGSDNDLESLAYMRAVYGRNDYAAASRQLTSRLNAAGDA